jgi:hypothetical protein
MKLRMVLLQGLLLSFLCSAACAQGNFYNGGPTSPYYIKANGAVYIITNSGSPFLQPNVQTFQTVYGGYEDLLAVSCYSSPCANINNSLGSVRTGGYGRDGVYTLSGVPTGTSYNVTYDFFAVYDGTSSQYGNFFVEHLMGDVYATDPYWQNPVPLPISTGPYHRPTGIAYDPYDNSLWLSFGPDSYLSEYSLSGNLLRQIPTNSNGNTALAFDSADGTLWMINGFMGGNSAYLEQYSTDGQLLQFGSVDAVPRTGFTAGDMPEPVPEPGTLVMMGTAIVGLAGVLRRKINR